MFAGVNVEEKIRESAFEARAQTFVDRESRARNLCGGLEIQNAGIFANFPVRARLEVKLRRSSPAPDFHIISGAFSHRHAGVRNIRDGEQKLFQAFVQLVDTLVVALQALGDFFHQRQKLRGVFAGSFLSRNFFAGAIALGLQALGGGDELAPLGVNLAKGCQVQRDAAVARHLFNGVEVLPYVSEIQHRPSRIQEGGRRCEATLADCLLAERPRGRSGIRELWRSMRGGIRGHSQAPRNSRPIISGGAGFKRTFGCAFGRASLLRDDGRLSGFGARAQPVPSDSSCPIVRRAWDARGCGRWKGLGSYAKSKSEPQACRSIRWRANRRCWGR